MRKLDCTATRLPRLSESYVVSRRRFAFDATEKACMNDFMNIDATSKTFRRSIVELMLYQTQIVLYNALLITSTIKDNFIKYICTCKYDNESKNNE